LEYNEVVAAAAAAAAAVTASSSSKYTNINIFLMVNHAVSVVGMGGRIAQQQQTLFNAINTINTINILSCSTFSPIT